jgi:hypothetical protein
VYPSNTEEKIGYYLNYSFTQTQRGYIIQLGKTLVLKPVTLIKGCLHKPYSRVHRGKHVFDAHPIQNSLQEANALTPFLLNLCFRINYLEEGKTSRKKEPSEQIPIE